MISISGQRAQLGFYFHIPFCAHICPYCDFIKSSRFSKKGVNSFFTSLKQQLLFFIEKTGAQRDRKAPATAYFGGGTPSLFPAAFYVPLIECLKEYYELEEMTLETNPFTNHEHRFFDYSAAQFDRITLGAQSLCPQTLSVLGRRHSADDILQNIRWARKAGFKQVQVDLIYGLKYGVRTLSVEQEVETLCKAGATGISAYALTLEKRTLFASSDLACEENAEQEYYALLRVCSSLGLQQLETSNFSFYPSRHNNIYWHGYPYIGIGTGAHGLLPPTQEFPYGRRYKVGEEIDDAWAKGDDKLVYTDKDSKERLFRLVYEQPRTKAAARDELIFTLLRTRMGIPLCWLRQELGSFQKLDFLLQDAKVKRALEEKKLQIKNDCLCLQPEEKIRGDLWASHLVFLSDCIEKQNGKYKSH